MSLQIAGITFDVWDLERANGVPLETVARKHMWVPVGPGYFDPKGRAYYIDAQALSEIVAAAVL